MSEKQLYEAIIAAGQEEAAAKMEKDMAATNHATAARKHREAEQALLDFLISCGVKQSEVKYEYSTIVLEVRDGSLSVDVPDIDAVPQPFLRMKAEPDKKKILETLKDGQLVNWATLKKGEPSLTIRSKANAK